MLSICIMLIWKVVFASTFLQHLRFYCDFFGICMYLFMHPVCFWIFQLKFFFFCFLKYLWRNLGTDSPFPNKAESKQQFLKRHNANLSSWLLLSLIWLTWTLVPLPVLFYFVNLWALGSVVSCCSLSLQMPVYYYPSGQYPTSTTQQYRPIASVQYNAQRSQQIPQTAQQAGIYICYSVL